MNENYTKYCKEKLKESGFYKVQEEFILFLDFLSDNIFNTVGIIKNNIIINQCFGMHSSLDTLKCLDLLLLKGNFIDTFVLLRKLRDNIFLDLCIYILAIDLKEKRFNPESNNVSFSEERLVDWHNNFYVYLHDGVNDLNDDEKRKFSHTLSYNNYHKILKETTNTESLEYIEKNLDKIQNELNNYVHSNGVSYLINERIKYESGAKIITQILEQLLKIIFIYVFLIDGTLISASNYTYYLETGYNPNDIEGMQYCIAPIAEEILRKIKNDNEAVYDYLLSHNEYNMDIKI